MPQIPLMELNLSTLQQLGGGAAFAQVGRLIEQAVEDITKRPGEERARSVKLQLDLVPVITTETDDETGSSQRVVDGVKLRLQMDVKLPARRTVEYDLGIGQGNTLLFNPASPTNHRQAVFPEIVEGAYREVVPLSG